MPLNVVSNYAANVAHRNLAMTDAQASQSLARLSIGKRVVSARDDAASMAIGSRMNAEVQGLKQAVVNAGQANSMLQIADGAMSTVSDILTRMKVLSIQASSENLGDHRARVPERRVPGADERKSTASPTTPTSTARSCSMARSRSPSRPTSAPPTASPGSARRASTPTAPSRSPTTAPTPSPSTDGTNCYTGTIAADLLDTNGALTRSTTLQLTSTTGAGSLIVALNTAFDAGDGGRRRGLHGRRHHRAAASASSSAPAPRPTTA